jgi:hypothetical protein
MDTIKGGFSKAAFLISPHLLNHPDNIPNFPARQPLPRLHAVDKFNKLALIAKRAVILPRI